jgi:hypothetical protein
LFSSSSGMKHPFDRCQGVTVHVGREGTMRDLEGNLVAIPGLAQKDKSPLWGGFDGDLVALPTGLVAGAGFEPVTFRL